MKCVLKEETIDEILKRLEEIKDEVKKRINAFCDAAKAAVDDAEKEITKTLEQRHKTAFEAVTKALKKVQKVRFF